MNIYWNYRWGKISRTRTWVRRKEIHIQIIRNQKKTFRFLNLTHILRFQLLLHFCRFVSNSYTQSSLIWFKQKYRRIRQRKSLCIVLNFLKAAMGDERWFVFIKILFLQETELGGLLESAATWHITQSNGLLISFPRDDAPPICPGQIMPCLIHGFDTANKQQL